MAVPLAALWLDTPAFALDPRHLLTQYVHDSWETRDGLPQNSVRALAQTPDGYLWLGTEEGLVRFDGVSFTVFDDTTTEALRHSFVVALLADHRGALWIGTSGGLVRLFEGRFTAYGTKDGLPGGEVRSLCEGRDGSVWAATPAGLGRIRDGRSTRYTTREGLSDNSVLAVHEDSSGSLWIGTRGGLDRFDGRRFAAYRAKDGLPDDRVTALGEDRHGRLWVGTQKGLCALGDGRCGAAGVQGDLPRRPVTAIRPDRHGNLWIGSWAGLGRLRDDRFERYGNVAGLGDDIVHSVLEDREGDLWVGSSGSGLHRLKDGAFLTYGTEEGLSHPSAAALVEDPSGALWVATEAGLNRFDGGRFTAYARRHDLSDRAVSLFVDRRGRLWLGTFGGLALLTDGRFTWYTTRDGLTDDAVGATVEDAGGALWLGTRRGLNRFEGGRFTHYTTKDGLVNDAVGPLAVGPDGALWIGTDGGLARHRGGVFSAYTAKDGLPDDRVLALLPDPDGTLWIGTERGLARLRNGRLGAFTKAHGLFDNKIFSILDDGRGYLWMSCNRGVFRVARAELDEVAARRRRSVTSISYGTTDGMRSSECNHASPSGWKTRDGRLWFPTLQGIVVVDPARLAPNTILPTVVVQRVVADGQVVEPAASVRLPAGTKAVEFHYAGLSLVAPEKVAYRYRLVGFDEEWVDAGHRRSAYYTNLRPGRYAFRVTACNNDGLWNEEGAVFTFSLDPHFYQTAWFSAACVLAAAGLAWGAYRVRLAQLGARNAVLLERARIAREVHDSLAQSLTAIVLQLHAAEGRLVGTQLAETLGRAKGLARDGLKTAEAVVRAMRSRADDAAQRGITEALGAFVRRMTDGTGIEASVEVVGRPRRLSSRAVEVEMLRIAEEAVTNALRHSGSSRIQVLVRWEWRSVRIDVRDEGKGFTALPLAAGRETPGLRGMAERAAAIGAKLRIDPHPAGGTLVSIEAPLAWWSRAG